MKTVRVAFVATVLALSITPSLAQAGQWPTNQTRGADSACPAEMGGGCFIRG